jgi:peptidoglycan/xylan/chitin deacetylase (PgdA/CDA1 family)
LWTTTVVGGPSSPAVSGGVEYVGSSDDKLYAFDAAGATNCSGSPKTCAPLWTAAAGGSGSPAVANGAVFTGVGAFDAAGSTNCSGSPKTCQPLWTFAGASGDPAVANGMVYVGSSDNHVYAFDAAGATNCSGSPKTCQPLWSATVGGVVTSPAVANGVVYVSSYNPQFSNALAAFDAAGTTNCSGSPKTCQPLWQWSQSTDVGHVSSPAVSTGSVYVVAEGGLYAFGPEKVPPTTSILVPSNGAALSGSTVLDASATDNVKVSRVEFHLTGGNFNNAFIGAATLTQYGWIYSWDTTSVPNGPYTLNSVAYDAAGNSSRSPNVNIAVQNYPPPAAKLYLTFDDGPSTYTPQVLSELWAGGAHATFFDIGEHAAQYPSYVQQEQAAGDTIGDHTWDHPFDITTLTSDQVRQELESTAEEIASLTGNRPSLWRPPGGKYNDTVVQIASSLGLSMRLWNVSSRDTENPGVSAIISYVVDRVRNGDIVLLHDGGGDRSQTVAALPAIIDTLRQRGYELDPLDATTGTQVTMNEAVVSGE